jgi:hypothetical protein
LVPGILRRSGPKGENPTVSSAWESKPRSTISWTPQTPGW